MSWIGRIFGGGVSDVAEAVGGVAEVFVGNKKDSNKQAHDSDMASKAQFASEFTQPSNGWFSSFINGWNRLPRPIIATMVVSYFPAHVYMSFNYPEVLSLMTQSLATIPVGMWALFSIIIGFYFGGRMQVKAKQFKMDKKAIERLSESVSEYIQSKHSRLDKVEHEASKEVVE